MKGLLRFSLGILMTLAATHSFSEISVNFESEYDVVVDSKYVDLSQFKTYQDVLDFIDEDDLEIIRSIPVFSELDDETLAQKVVFNIRPLANFGLEANYPFYISDPYVFDFLRPNDEGKLEQRRVTHQTIGTEGTGTFITVDENGKVVSLSMLQNDRNNPIAIPEISKLDQLKNLRLTYFGQHPDDYDFDLESLNVEQLRTLSISYSDIPIAKLNKVLERAKELEVLELFLYGQAGHLVIDNVESLKGLYIYTPAGLTGLTIKNVPNLKTMKLNIASHTLEEFNVPFETMDSLTELSLPGYFSFLFDTSDYVAPPNLEVLLISNGNTQLLLPSGQHGVPRWKWQNDLEELWIYNVDDFSFLADFPKVKRMKVGLFRGADPEFDWSKLALVEGLEALKTKHMTDAGLEHIAKIESLQYLDFMESKITTTLPLAEMPNLHYLDSYKSDLVEVENMLMREELYPASPTCWHFDGCTEVLTSKEFEAFYYQAEAFGETCFKTGQCLTPLWETRKDEYFGTLLNEDD